MARHRAQPFWVKGDLDGFFGLAVDNLIQFILILGLCRHVLGFPDDLILGTVLPGAAVSLVVGNLFYAWQAQRLSARTGRRDVTALPYGINTVSLFAYVFLVMLPVKLAASSLPADEAARRAWQVGLAACFFSGVIELLGSLIAEWIRRHTPRAALLATLAGIAISFISIDFAVRTFASPLVALLPLAVILATYFSGIKLPLHLPGGLWAVLLGGSAAWITSFLGRGKELVSVGAVEDALSTVGLHLPGPFVSDLIAGLSHEETWLYVLSVFVPMGLFNVLGSLQNIESAEAAGDPFPTGPSLFVNGLGTMAGACFGSCFPTTIYIGHPGWKGLGARSGYSVANALAFTVIGLFGLTSLVAAVFPLESGMAIVLWIGIVITAQAFQSTPRAHASAVAVGLFPAIAAWGALILGQTLSAAQLHTGDLDLGRHILADGRSLAAVGLELDGLVALSTGFMLTCTLWAAISTFLIERKFGRAAIWASIGGTLALVGLIHVGHMSPEGIRYDLGLRLGVDWAIGYGLAALFFGLLAASAAWKRRTGLPKELRAPWTAQYHDGSGNGFRFWQESETGDVCFDYRPVSPEESSSGTYSGGSENSGSLDDPTARELVKKLLELAANTSLHTDMRAMGTGAFLLKAPDGQGTFIVAKGPRLDELEAFLDPLRGI